MSPNPRRLVRAAIDASGDVLSRLIARVAAARLAGRDVVVLDIDNTIADSWPTFLVPHDSETARLASIAPLPGMKAATHDAAVASGAAVLYLSHRHPWHWGVTLRWLRTNGYRVSPLSLMLVSSPQRKPELLRILARSAVSLEVWDDLSAGHEHGEVRRYDDVRAEIERIATRWHGPDEIDAIVSAALGGANPS